QNPSIVLAALLCFLKPLGYKLIIDRHSNFKLYTLSIKSFKWRAFHFLSRYTLKKADLTIVTNKYLADLVIDLGGRSFVLPDKLPALDKHANKVLGGVYKLVFVCTYSADEPVLEVFEALRYLGEDYQLYVTGNFRKWRP